MSILFPDEDPVIDPTGTLELRIQPVVLLPQGFCLTCKWPVVKVTLTDDSWKEFTPDAKAYPLHLYCSNKTCTNHQGIGVLSVSFTPEGFWDTVPWLDD
jgi:hypothetical protein